MTLDENDEEYDHGKQKWVSNRQSPEICTRHNRLGGHPLEGENSFLQHLLVFTYLNFMSYNKKEK
ncbi:hypothetical protein BOTCAL_0532g00010 [Botryotinia calthae]|uniref:Uncharacterized protein n=1 Tax=Botryotinia calthae TaxID=38488 RepID=A0A4Y8CMR3_9HELO|nr:hypothetical protein BOTCAL_0532g00010 [Botryotinia calthae]